MQYIQKALVLDGSAMDRSLMRIAHEIIEHNDSDAGLRFVGIRRRGVPLAKQIAEYVKKFSGAEAPVGELDITLYRDDLTELSDQATVNTSELSFGVSGRPVVLVDDVIYTGRTARAAIDAVIKQGRPSSIQLAVLIDRGHRELPIRPDYVGKNIPTSRHELIAVRIPPIDQKKEVAILEQK